MQEKTKKRISVIALLAAVLAGLLIQLLLPGLGVRAEAAEENTPYLSVDIMQTSARSDLISMKKDNLSFISDNKNIFIAMSQYRDLNNNLRSFVYLNYIGDEAQDDMKISLSTATSDQNYQITENFSEYDLQLINKDSQCNWCKFEILGLKNLDYTTRRYYLSSLLVNGEKALDIEQVFIFNGFSNESIEVFNQEIETIEITDTLVKFFCYGDENDFGKSFGYKGGYEPNINPVVYKDNFYIFFNTDKKMDELKEVEVLYDTFTYKISWDTYGYMNYPVQYDIEETLPGTDLDKHLDVNEISELTKDQIVTILPGTETISYDVKNWYGKYDTCYKTTDNIIDLKKYRNDNGSSFEFYDESYVFDWGVKFLSSNKNVQSNFGVNSILTNYSVEGTGVTDVAILRLRFVTDGIEHNCYAVDIPDKYFAGEAVDDGETSTFDDFMGKIVPILTVFVLVVCIGAVVPSIKPILDGVVSVIRLPFDLIASLFRKRK